MNVIVSNRAVDELNTLDIDLLKSINGEYDSSELISMFKNFFFNKMILDITAIKEYANIENIQKISIDLDPSKIILYLPNDPIVNSNTFLSQLISMGFYNFTTNIDGVKYLLEHTNTYRDVAHIQDVKSSINGSNEPNRTIVSTKIIGIKNLTEHAGATTLCYMLHKEMRSQNMNSYAIEVDKHDFSFFNDIYMVSASDNDLAEEVLKYKDADAIFIDLNNSNNEKICSDIIYLLEPSIVKLNKLILRDKGVFERLKDNKIVLNQNTLEQNDLTDLEYEAKTKFFYTIPSVNDRESNEYIKTLLIRMGIVVDKNDKEKSENPLNKLFSLFKND